MRVCWHVFWIGFQGPSDQRRIFSRPEQRKVSELTFKTSIFIWSWSNNTFRGLIGKWFWHQQPQEKNDYEERPSAKREEPYFRVYSKKFQPNFHLIRVWFSRFAVGGNRIHPLYNCFNLLTSIKIKYSILLKKVKTAWQSTEIRIRPLFVSYSFVYHWICRANKNTSKFFGWLDKNVSIASIQ